jgi:hypothetical protein
LIAINFVIWVKTAESPGEVENETLTNVAEDKPMENCPACNFKLTTNESTCPDCGLTLQQS